MTRRRPSAPLALLLGAALLAGCASGPDPRLQKITVEAPPGAAVAVDGRPAVGVSGEFMLERKYTHTLAIAPVGMPAEEYPIASRINGGKVFMGLVGYPVLMGVINLAIPVKDKTSVFLSGLAVGALIGIPTTIGAIVSGRYYELSPLQVRTKGGWDAAPPVAGAAPLMAAGGKRLTLAVMNLTPVNVSGADAQVITEMVRTKFVEGGTFMVIEKSNMDKVLAEQAFQQSGCTTQDCAVKLGHVLNAQIIALGTFSKFQNEFLLHLRLVSVETAQVLYSGTSRGPDLKSLEADGEKMRQEIRTMFRAPDGRPTPPLPPPVDH